ncbi:MAG: PASTA domain-containing protein [Clostridia bacterium]|nr:PASTA domain-containing protein [Clostridia bacterium]MBQ7788084.1 PASTA domain-containing protein [Clostridia bacterium]
MENKKINAKMVKRSTFLLIAFSIISVIIIFALFKLQILGYSDYQDEVINQLTVETSVNPLRGNIFDRNGNTLATNKTVWVLYLCPKNIKNPEFIAKELSDILGCDYNKVLEKAKKTGYKYQVIDNAIDKETADRIRKFIDENGLTEQIQLNASSKRYYPFADLASHALGFVNADGIGIYGLEKVYNNILEGTNGKYITAQNAQSGDMPFQYETYIEDENGYHLVSTIDMYIQYQLESQLEMAAIESGAQNRAAGIVMNPKTGEIYAMAVYPSFDLNQPYILDELSSSKLNDYEKGSSEYKKEYLNLLFSMWNNKAVTELYEPGSTFKLVTTSVALQEGVASLKNSYTCTGSLKIDGYYRAISCHKRKGHGTLTFAQALQQSCNPSMMKLAFSIGKNTFYDYFKKFGYTSKTGIDLPSEANGYYHSFDEFSNVSLAVYSFGQTFKTTAIQQLRAVSVVANGGYLVTPHLIKEIIDNEGNTVFEYNVRNSEQIISTEVSKTISQILKEGVDGEGGAKNAYVAGYSIAAKTGTSEKKDKYDESGNTSYRVSSCIAYAPSEDAQVAVIILVDEPTIGSKYGSVVAAPYVSSLMELILPYLGFKAEYNENDLEHIQVEVPNLISKSIYDIKSELKDISYEIIGNGDTVITQMPLAGSKIYKKTGKIILYTGMDLERTVIVPNVVGMSPEKANLLLTNSGLNIKIEGSTNFKIGQGATVVSQYPSALTTVRKGEVITIKILFSEEKD